MVEVGSPDHELPGQHRAGPVSGQFEARGFAAGQVCGSLHRSEAAGSSYCAPTGRTGRSRPGQNEAAHPGTESSIILFLCDHVISPGLEAAEPG